MLRKVLQNLCDIFDFIHDFWEGKTALKIISNILVLSFVLGFIIYGLTQLEIIHTTNDYITHPFFAIEISFTLLLLVELFSLIFVLPNSVAKSNIKQYELLSLIFLRSGFKEFSHIDKISDLSLTSQPIIHMFAYGFGGLILFVLVHITYKLQKHTQLTSNEEERKDFLMFKKILASLLLISFLIIGYFDTKKFIITSHYAPSFETFYNILIFSDILIVLFALRYTTKYIHIFRYSAFVLATIFIRISFSMKYYNSVIIGIIGALFVLLLTYAYNQFVKKKKTKQKLIP